MLSHVAIFDTTFGNPLETTTATCSPADFVHLLRIARENSDEIDG